MKRIVITGSSGYVGNVLVHHLVQQGWFVIGFDLRPHFTQKKLSKKQFAFCEGDIRDRKKLRDVFKKNRVSHVIHLAYFMDPQHDKKVEYDVDVNGSKYIIEIASEQASVEQIVVFSSTSIYGAHTNSPVWYSEDSITNPLDYEYAKNKKIVEEFVDRFQTKKKIVLLRMCTAVGSQYYKPGGVVVGMTKPPFCVNIGGKNTLLQFIHEDDLTALIELVVDDKKIKGVYNLCPDSYTSIRRLAKTFGKPVIPIPYWLFKGVISLLWTFRLTTVAPPCVKLMMNGIVATPKKLMDRYAYRFKFSSNEAFINAVQQRRRNKTL